MNERLQNAFCVQINKELYSAYLYLSMQTYFKEMNLEGFANWMNVQVQEELAHAMGMYNYVLERGGKVTLMNVEKPDDSWDSPLNVFEKVLEHERYVTSSINDLTSVAEEIKDRAAISLLQWYIKEQVEEEANVSNVLGNLKLAQNDPRALLLLDRELATRTFVAPVIG